MSRERLTIRQVQLIETYILRIVSQLCEKHSINYSLYCGSILGCVRHFGSIPWDTDVDIIISIADYELFLKCCNELPKEFVLQYYPKDKSYNGVHPRIGLNGIDIEWIHVDVFMYSGLPQDNHDQLTYIRNARKKLEKYHKKSDIIFKKGNLIENSWRTVYHYLRSLVIAGSKNELFENYILYSRKYDVRSSDYVTEIGCNQYGEKKIFERDIFENTIIRPYENIEVRIPVKSEEFLELLYGNWRQYPSIEEQNRAANVVFEANSDTLDFLRKKGVL